MRELTLDLSREDDLAHLALVGSLGREQQALHHLLGDRAGALGDAPFAQVGEGGAEDRDQVDAGMLEEMTVLGRDEGDLDVARDLVDRDEPTLLCVEFADQLPVPVVDFADDRRAVVIEVVEIGKVSNQEYVDRQPHRQPRRTAAKASITRAIRIPPDRKKAM